MKMKNTQQQIPIQWVEVQFAASQIIHSEFPGSPTRLPQLARARDRKRSRPGLIDRAGREKILREVARSWFGMEPWIKVQAYPPRGRTAGSCLCPAIPGQVIPQPMVARRNKPI